MYMTTVVTTPVISPYPISDALGQFFKQQFQHHHGNRALPWINYIGMVLFSALN